ncbi:MAG TPA: hypothetical protein VHJ20_10335 [Polyangia bacterium]|nr:hypothetical protein [Polyangia bacterium]
MWTLLSGASSAAEPATVPPPAPEVDAASVTLFPDQGRLELKGAHLKGLRVAWKQDARAGDDVCVDPKPIAGAKDEQCAFALPRDLPADVSLSWSASGAVVAKGASPTPAQVLRPARVVIDRLLPAAMAVDLTSGAGRIPLLHAEAVSAVDCAPARCELSDASVLVRSVSGAATGVNVRVRLAPHVFSPRGDVLEAVVTRVVPVLHCQAAVVSGAPLRHAEGTRVVVRLDDRCGREARDLRWTTNGDVARVERVERTSDATYVQLAAAEIDDSQLTITASRAEPDASVLAVASVATRAAPQPRATLELPGFGRVAFIPTNRDAVLHMASVGESAHLVPLSVEGAYRVSTADHTVRVRAEESAGGFVALRFGYRATALPPAFDGTDLAILTESVQRPIREASVPAPLGESVSGPAPLIEMMCSDANGGARRIAPGPEASIPFSQRESCRLIIHRERLKVEEGTQDITVDVSVAKVDDSPRADAHVSERMVLRPGAAPRTFWIHGVQARFDRITVRVSHVVDEAHDIGGSEVNVNLPSAQWLIVVGEGHLRFYATAAIPTGLFRITAPSDVLTLNFGALSRLTWLDHEGHEGLLGLEFGAMGIGLAATPGFPRTLAVLGGVGVSVPIGNRGETSQASVNLHAWIAYELRDDVHEVPTDLTSPLASHWSFLFGPSITIGNVGTNL